MSQVDADRLVMLLAGSALAWKGSAAEECESLAELAIQCDVAPWIYASLRAKNVELPQELAARLRQAYVASAARNMGLFHQLGKILREFHTANIPVIPLKGACLAEEVYGSIALRPMADVDLLVKSGEIPRALDLLRTLGYDSRQPFDPILEEKISQHMPPTSNSSGLAVELHWTILCPAFQSSFTNADLEELWSRAVPAKVAGVSTRMLSPTDLLLHLCVHVSAQHRFDDLNLRCFLDIAKVVKRYGNAIDWGAFAERANTWRVANAVRLALVLAEQCTDLRCPAAAMHALKAEPLDEGTIAWARQKILNGNALSLRSDVARLGASTTVGEKLATLRDVVFPPRPVMARMYSAPSTSWRILAFYLVRLKDLLVRYHAELWLVIRRDKGFIADARKEARLREYLGWR